MANTRPLILLDMDETLLFASLDPLQEANDELRSTRDERARAQIKSFIQFLRTAKPVVFTVRRETYYVYPRPGVQRALLRAFRHADLVILTAADQDYAEGALDALGIKGLFVDVLSTRTPGLKVHPHTRGRTWSLIDDLPRSHENTRKKLRLANQGGAGTFWPVSPWGPGQFTGISLERALELSLPVGANQR